MVSYEAMLKCRKLYEFGFKFEPLNEDNFILSTDDVVSVGKQTSLNIYF